MLNAIFTTSLIQIAREYESKDFNLDQLAFKQVDMR